MEVVMLLRCFKMVLKRLLKVIRLLKKFLNLIELEDDDKISSNSSLSEAIMETKEALAAQRADIEGEYMGVRRRTC